MRRAYRGRSSKEPAFLTGAGPPCLSAKGNLGDLQCQVAQERGGRALELD